MDDQVLAQAERVRHRRLAVGGMRFDDPFAARAFASLLVEVDELLRLLGRESVDAVATRTHEYVGHVATRCFPRADG